MKSLVNLIEEASRLDKELKKMSPEKQMQILRKLNSANLESFEHYVPGLTPTSLINLKLTGNPNSEKYSKAFDTLRNLNILDLEYPNLINKNIVANDFRTNLRKFIQAQSEYYNNLYNTPLSQLKTRKNIRKYRNRLNFSEIRNENKNNKTLDFFDKNQKFGVINGGSYTKALLDLHGNRAEKLKGVYSDRDYLNSRGLWVHHVPVNKNTNLDNFIETVKNDKESPLGYSYSYANRRAYDYLDKPAIVYGIINGDNVLKTLNSKEAFIPNDKYQNGEYKIEVIDPKYRAFNNLDLSDIEFFTNEKNGLANQERYLNEKGKQKFSKRQAALEAQRKAEEEAKRQAALEAQRKAEEEARKRAEEEARKQATLKRAKERHEQRPFYQPYLTATKRYFRTHPNVGYTAASLGGLGAGALGYNLFSDDVSDRIHELLRAL